jgi:oleate hydratase
MYRDPEYTHAWLVGSGIASLAAAVHLIQDAMVPARNIHILDVHRGTGGGIKSCGTPENGYVLYSGCLPYFQDKCMEDLLSLVPSANAPDMSILDTIRDFERNEVPSSATTRILRRGDSGPEKVDACHLDIGFQQRLQLLRIILERENSLRGRRIQEFFDETFVESNFWSLWSTT